MYLENRERRWSNESAERVAGSREQWGIGRNEPKGPNEVPQDPAAPAAIELLGPRGRDTRYRFAELQILLTNFPSIRNCLRINS